MQTSMALRAAPAPGARVIGARATVRSALSRTGFARANASSVPAPSSPSDAEGEKNVFLDRPVEVRVEAEPQNVVPPEPVDEDRANLVLRDTMNFLRTDLERLFETGTITRSRYSPDITFEDPVTRYEGIDGYLFNINLLKSVFDIKFKLLKLDITAVDQITSRWSMTMKMWPLPWQPTLTFTGITEYGVDPNTGIIQTHFDRWDAIEYNRFLSLEGLQHLMSQVLNVQQTPDLETPDYTVLKKTADYEIRSYSPYMVAETSMGPGTGPAGGNGFNELAGYIFGGNSRSASMEMTAPVITATPETPGDDSSMAFVMERRYGSDPDALPAPTSDGIKRRLEAGSIVATCTFSGWPLDSEVVDAERGLRAALQKDGIAVEAGYKLARYNDPTTLPFLRRNEVLIKVVADEAAILG